MEYSKRNVVRRAVRRIHQEVAPRFDLSRSGSADPVIVAPPPGGREVSLAIGGMTCGACAARIQHRLNKLEGVTASVNFATERARVTLPRNVETGDLLEAVAAIGYRAQVLDGSAAAPEEAEQVADRRRRSLGRRLLVSALLFMPLGDLSLIFWLIPRTRFTGWQWLLVVLASPVVTWAAWPFYRAALRGARHGIFTMDTLVSIGIVSSAAYSFYAIFFQHLSTGHPTLLTLFSHRVTGVSYLDVAAGVTTFLLGGRYFEASTKHRTGSALRSLAELGAKEVAIVDAAGNEELRPVRDLTVGSLFVVRPGERVATDGEVVSGSCSIDRSAMTGESIPVEVDPGDQVVGGTVAVGGRIVVRATRVGSETQLAQMIRLVEDAQNEKANVQRLADRVSAVFVPAVIVATISTLLGWLLVGDGDAIAINAALSVLIIACPCALGLATPTALVVASGEGARRGIFFKGYSGLEASRSVDTVVLDKTGTVTSGDIRLRDVVAAPGVPLDEVLRLSGSVESASEHLLARAIHSCALEALHRLAEVEDFTALPGLGARGRVEGHEVTVGRPALFASLAIGAATEVQERCAAWESEGLTAVFVGRDGGVIGALGLADAPRPSAAPAVGALRSLGLECILLTGDNAATARAVGRAIGINDVVAGALPSDKVAHLRALQSAGRRVAMVGDGVNDGPALAASDLGIAVGSGTDVALNAADLIVVRDDLTAVATAIALARRTMRKIRGNLIWAFGYNVAAVPIAACGLLNPLIAGAAMAFSSAFVVWNSATISRFSASGRTAETAFDQAMNGSVTAGEPAGTPPVQAIGAGGELA